MEGMQGGMRIRGEMEKVRQEVGFKGTLAQFFEHIRTDPQFKMKSREALTHVLVLGGLSLLHNNQPPLTTLTWMLFVYTVAVLSPLAGILAAADLLRRWRRNRAAEMAYPGYSGDLETGEGQAVVEPAGGAQAIDAPEEPALQHPAPPAPKAAKKSSKQAGRKQAA